MLTALEQNGDVLSTTERKRDLGERKTKQTV